MEDFDLNLLVGVRPGLMLRLEAAMLLMLRPEVM